MFDIIRGYDQIVLIDNFNYLFYGFILSQTSLSMKFNLFTNIIKINKTCFLCFTVNI